MTNQFEEMKATVPDALNICAMPGNFHKAIGYRGPAMWLGVYWDAKENRVATYDGIADHVGAVPHPYVLLVSHIDMIAGDNGFKKQLVNGLKKSEYWLMVDITNQDIYFAPRNQARAWIKSQTENISLDLIRDLNQMQIEPVNGSLVIGRIRLGAVLPSLEPLEIIFPEDMRDEEMIACGGCEGIGYQFSVSHHAWIEHSICNGTGYDQGSVDLPDFTRVFTTGPN